MENLKLTKMYKASEKEINFPTFWGLVVQVWCSGCVKAERQERLTFYLYCASQPYPAHRPVHVSLVSAVHLITSGLLLRGALVCEQSESHDACLHIWMPSETKLSQWCQAHQAWLSARVMCPMGAGAALPDVSSHSLLLCRSTTGNASTAIEWETIINSSVTQWWELSQDWSVLSHIDTGYMARIFMWHRKVDA